MDFKKYSSNIKLIKGSKSNKKLYALYIALNALIFKDLGKAQILSFSFS